MLLVFLMITLNGSSHIYQIENFSQIQRIPFQKFQAYYEVYNLGQHLGLSFS